MNEDHDHCEVGLRSDDGRTCVAVVGHVIRTLPSGSLFRTLEEASAFFQRGAVGYSATRRPSRFDGLELRVAEWHVEALSVDHVASSFFDDASRFPRGSATFDCALIMRGVHHSWHALPTLSHSNSAAPAA